MQKKIIALAVAGLMSGAAFAQSNVTIYGVLDVGYLNSDAEAKTNVTAGGFKYHRDTQATGFDTGALSTSRLGFKGTEDLGNGLKANFNLEYGLNNATNSYKTDRTDAFRIRQQWLSLSSANWGEVRFGRQDLVSEPVWGIGSTGMKNNAVGDLYSGAPDNGGTGNAPSQVVGVNMTSNARVSDAITYYSPNFSGFQVMAQYGKNEADQSTRPTTAGVTTNADTDTTIWGVGGTYMNGPLSLGLSYVSMEVDTNATTSVAGTAKGTTDNINSWTVAGSYDFKVAKVFAVYTDNENDNSRPSTAAVPAVVGVPSTFTAAVPAVTNYDFSESDGWEIGVHVPMGAWTFMASYMDGDQSFRAVPLAGVAPANRTSVDIDGFQLGALYALSKRTTAYIMYGDLDYDYSRLAGVAGAKGDVDIQQWAVGLRHSF